MHEGRATILEHLNFFNKFISKLLAVDVKIDEEARRLYFSVRFHSYTIIL